MGTVGRPLCGGPYSEWVGRLTFLSVFFIAVRPPAADDQRREDDDGSDGGARDRRQEDAHRKDQQGAGATIGHAGIPPKLLGSEPMEGEGSAYLPFRTG